MKLIGVLLVSLTLIACAQVEPGDDVVIDIPDRDLPTEKY